MLPQESKPTVPYIRMKAYAFLARITSITDSFYRNHCTFVRLCGCVCIRELAVELTFAQNRRPLM